MAFLLLAVSAPSAHAMGRSSSARKRDPVQRVPAPASAKKAGPGASTTEPETPTGDVQRRGTSQSGTDAKTATTGPDAGRGPIGNNTGANDPGNAGGTGGTFGTSR